jgi:hypothetical protein
LLLRDILRGDDPQITAAIAIIDDVSPDVLLLTDFDYDLDGLALAAFANVSGYEYYVTARPNTGLMTGYDLDQNGRLRDARDAMGYGRFAGDGGMAVLAHMPIDLTRDLSTLLWKDLPGAALPTHPDADAIYDMQRLSHGAHWVVTVDTPEGDLSLLAFSASPPVFDGPEDRNGLRNRDELRMWSLLIDGALGDIPQDFVIAGNANLDPVDGDGYADAMRAFLGDPKIQDPLPSSEGAAHAADSDHNGDPSLDTADWPDTRPGNLRVSYVLPAASWQVLDAGVFWPAPDDPKAALLGKDGLLAGAHRLVWVDIMR